MFFFSNQTRNYIIFIKNLKTLHDKEKTSPTSNMVYINDLSLQWVMHAMVMFIRQRPFTRSLEMNCSYVAVVFLLFFFFFLIFLTTQEITHDEKEQKEQHIWSRQRCTYVKCIHGCLNYVVRDRVRTRRNKREKKNCWPSDHANERDSVTNSITWSKL